MIDSIIGKCPYCDRPAKVTFDGKKDKVDYPCDCRIERISAEKERKPVEVKDAGTAGDVD